MHSYYRSNLSIKLLEFRYQDKLNKKQLTSDEYAPAKPISQKFGDYTSFHNIYSESHNFIH